MHSTWRKIHSYIHIYSSNRGKTRRGNPRKSSLNVKVKMLSCQPSLYLNLHATVDSCQAGELTSLYLRRGTPQYRSLICAGTSRVNHGVSSSVVAERAQPSWGGREKGKGTLSPYDSPLQLRHRSRHLSMHFSQLLCLLLYCLCIAFLPGKANSAALEAEGVHHLKDIEVCTTLCSFQVFRYCTPTLQAFLSQFSQ